MQIEKSDLGLHCLLRPAWQNNINEPVKRKPVFGVSRQKVAGAQFEGDLGEILPYIVLREKWESP